MNNELFPRLKSRYKDGYIVALAIVGVGTGVKVIGVFAGILIVLAGFIATVDSGRSGAGLALGFIVGGIVTTFFYVIGTLVSAQGQILRATLDSAVNNSPHISNEEKAEIMFLSSAPSDAKPNFKRLFWGGTSEAYEQNVSQGRGWGDDGRV